MWFWDILSKLFVHSDFVFSHVNIWTTIHLTLNRGMAVFNMSGKHQLQNKDFSV